MLESAANNHQRFVRAALQGHYSAPGYEQNGWVDVHGYQDLSWPTLLGWWAAAHELLKQVVARIPQEKLGSMCVVGEAAAVTFEFLTQDYVLHQRHHLAQIVAPLVEE